MTINSRPPATKNPLAANGMLVLFPLLALLLYLISFSALLPLLLPGEGDNVNADFAGRAWKYVLALLAGLYLVFFGVVKLTGEKVLAPVTQAARLHPGDLFLLLVPLTPVVRYILNNQDILSPWGSIWVLGMFAIFAMIFIILAPAVLGLLGPVRPLAILGLAFSFTITNMASLTATHDWYERGSLPLQLAIFGGVFLVSLLIHRVVGRRFLYFVATVYFVANTAFQLTGPEPSAGEPVADQDAENNIVQLVGTRTPSSTPNIYLLVYDAYVANETLLGHGIDNSAQEDYLRGLGFKLYPHTYSVAGATVSTISRTLNASKSYFGAPRKAVAGNGIIHQVLKKFGYETQGIFYSDYFFQGLDSTYDVSYPPLKPTYLLLSKAILMGEFRFDVEFDNPTHEQFAKLRLRKLKKTSSRPRFIYVHNDLPGHSQNSGNCRPDETELFESRLVLANAEMKQDLDLVTDRDPGAIIAVAGDHGPYLTKNCSELGGHFDISDITRQDIQDRVGTFLAIKWPDDSYSAYDDVNILQDLFLVVLAVLFQDESFLGEKIHPLTICDQAISGASVLAGTIQGGVHDGQPLFLADGD